MASVPILYWSVPAVGTVLTLRFLPALYSIWFGVKPTAVPSDEVQCQRIHSRKEVRSPNTSRSQDVLLAAD
jgi:hypothetical protein